MLGISYGGISQLFAAQLEPPALAAIAPLSVLDATATTLYPGGVLNTGFAVPWAEERQFDAEPAGPDQRRALGLRTDPERRHDLRGQPGSARRGDEPARGNQRKRDLQPVGGRPAGPGDVRAQHQRADVHGLPVGGRADRRALRRSGGALHRHRSSKWFTFTNGAHIDSLDPATLQPAVRLPGAVRRAPGAEPNRAILDAAARSSTRRRWASPKDDNVTLPPDPIQEQPTYEQRWRPSQRSRRSGCCSTTAREPRRPAARRAGNPYPGVRTVVLGASRSPARRRARGTSGPGGTLDEEPATAPKGSTPTPRTRAPRR